MSSALAVCHGVFGRVTVYRFDRPMRAHAHREAHLIFHLSGPPAILTISGVSHLVDQSAGVAINPWQPHLFRPCRDDEPGVFLVAYICDRWLDRGNEGRGDLRFGGNRIPFGAPIRTIAFELAESLVAGANYRIVNRGLNRLFDASLDNSWSKGGRQSRAARSTIDFRVRKSLQFLGNNLMGRIDIEALARNVGLSRPHFFKLFRENTGVTPILYANTMRIERALDRLTGSGASVTDISAELGFCSSDHFTHFFAAHVGLAPTLYRTIARVVSE